MKTITIILKSLCFLAATFALAEAGPGVTRNRKGFKDSFRRGDRSERRSSRAQEGVNRRL
jgi:hypothetical protein